MKHTIRPAKLFWMLAILTGCASAGSPGHVTGTSGAVAWKVVDAHQRIAANRQAVRWYYTLVLKETAGRAIQFEREQVGAYGGRVESIPREYKFEQRLNANSELRVNRIDELYDIRRWPPEGYIKFRRFVGRDDAGNRVVVDVRISLESSFGAVAEAPATPVPLPADAKAVRPHDAASLMGTWQGYYRDGSGFEIPLRLTVRDDGSFEAAEDEPVRNRFRGTLSVRDGEITYTQRNDTGTAVLYEGAGKRLLDGRFGGKREGLPNQPGAAPYTANYLLRLEAASSKPEPKPANVGSVPSDADRASVVVRAALLDSEARRLLERRQYAEGVVKAEEALKIWESREGDRSYAVADTLNTLAMLESGQGNHDRAEGRLLEALAVLEEGLWANSPLTATVRENLAEVRRTRGSARGPQPIPTPAPTVSALAATPPAAAPPVPVSAALTGTYEGEGRFLSPAGRTATYTLALVQNGTAVSGSYASSTKDVGTVTATLTGAALSGQLVSARDRDTCDVNAVVSDDGATLQGTFACKNGVAASFRFTRR